MTHGASCIQHFWQEVKLGIAELGRNPPPLPGSGSEWSSWRSTEKFRMKQASSGSFLACFHLGAQLLTRKQHKLRKLETYIAPFLFHLSLQDKSNQLQTVGLKVSQRLFLGFSVSSYWLINDCNLTPEPTVNVSWEKQRTIARDQSNQWHVGSFFIISHSIVNYTVEQLVNNRNTIIVPAADNTNSVLWLESVFFNWTWLYTQK